jgi:hypothetical protein
MHGKMKDFKSEPDDGTQKAVLKYEWKSIRFWKSLSLVMRLFF